MNGRFYKVPQDIAARKDLRASDKIVYAVIMDHLGNNDHCWPGVRMIAKKTGLALQTVVNSIERLENGGLIYVQRNGIGKSNHYKSVSKNRMVQKLERSKIHNSGVLKSSTEVFQKLEHNQTDLLNQTYSVSSDLNSDFAFVLKNGNTWHLPQDKFEQYQRVYPAIDVGSEFTKAARWLEDNPARRKTGKGMARFLNGWLARAKPYENHTGSEDTNKQPVWDAAAEQAFLDANTYLPTEEEAERIMKAAGML